MKFYRNQKVELFYFTDPFCYHCWDQEPELNKILQIYGDYLDLHVLMGGSFLDYNPASLLPSRTFKVFTASSPEKSLAFLRLLRSSIFNENRDLNCEDQLRFLINQLGERGGEILARSLGEEGERRMEEDLRLAKRFEIKELPCFVLVHGGKSQRLSKRLEQVSLEEKLRDLLGFLPARGDLRGLDEELRECFRLYPRDLEVLYGIPLQEQREFVEERLIKGSYQWVDYGEGVYLEACYG